MFGYILPDKPEMKIKEYEMFRAYYCGVCKSIAARHGQLERLVLNYDSAFLAVLISSLAGEIPGIKKEACIAHWVNKRYIIKDSKIVDYAADINVILAYYSMQDKKTDADSAVAGAATLVLARAARKLKKIYPQKCGEIEKRLKELRVLEIEGCSSMDRAAEPFAKLMEEAVAYTGIAGVDKAADKALRWLGYNLGKWIYILDAYDDLENDIKKNNYNPLLKQFEYSGGDVAEFRNKIRDRVEFNLTTCLNQISKSYELLGIHKNTGILENIIYLGMLRKTEKIIDNGERKEVE